MRAKEYAILKNLPFSKFSDLFHLCFGFSVNPNMNLSVLEFEKLDLFLENADALDELNYVSNVIFSFDIPSEFNQKNNFSRPIELLLGDNEDFNAQNGISKKFNDISFNSIFTDFEAFSICLGLTDRHSRAIARAFFQNQNSGMNVDEAHYLSHLALLKYGLSTLKFIISLPPLPFKSFDALPLFATLDKRHSNNPFPIVRLSFLNEFSHIEKIQFSYYSEKFQDKKVKFNNIIQVKNLSTGKSLFKISRDGIIIPTDKPKAIVPIIRLFITFVKDTQKAILNYGLETGECSICGRPLSDPISIQRGIGPICFSYLNL